MARALRVVFPGAVYLVMSRGEHGRPIYEDERDRDNFLEIVAEVVEHFNWRCYAYCLMPRFYQLEIQTPDANLSAGMRNLNGMYTQAWNRRHGRGGRLFQGRYRSLVIDPESYLLQVARQIVLNPVQEGLAKAPDDWPRSSYRATAGEERVPPWLDVNGLLRHFESDLRDAQAGYKRFVSSDANGEGLFSNVRQQLYLGNDEFVRRVQAVIEMTDEPGTTSIDKLPATNLDEIVRFSHGRNRAIVEAYKTGGYSYADLGKYFRMHPSSIGRVIRPRAPRTDYAKVRV